MAEVLKFSEDHLWVRVEGRHAVIGISDHLQEEIGEVSSIHLLEGGEEVASGEPLGEIDAAEGTRELVSPLTGVIVARNDELEDQPTLVNDDPYREGWLVRIELREKGELEDLLDPDEYEELLAEWAEEAE